MASPDRRSARDLIAEIGDQAPRFRFFQAVRLLALASKEPSLPAGVRFSSPLSLGFPASEIVDAQRKRSAGTQGSGDDEAREILHVAVGFMGMIGPSAALPVTYTETLIERRNFHRDTAAHGFLDMFTHRSVSLFYQAWRKYRFHLAYEAGDRETFTRHVLDLVGAGLNATRADDGRLPRMLLGHFAGLLAQRPISATSMAALLRGYFRVDVSVEQFVGHWILVPQSEQTRLGSQHCTLDGAAAAGGRQWDRQNKIRLRMGPLDGERFADFLPGRPGAGALRALVEFCIGRTLACDVSLVLRKEYVPQAVLGQPSSAAIRLGYNAWLHGTVPSSHQDDACFTILT